jgi:hypothetical protein
VQNSQAYLLVSPKNLPVQESLIYEARLAIGSAKIELHLKKSAEDTVNFEIKVLAKTFIHTILKYTFTSRINEKQGTLFYKETDELKESTKQWQRDGSHFFYEATKKGTTSSISSFEFEGNFIQDIAASVYSLRNSDLEVGYEVRLQTFRKEYPVEVRLSVIDERNDTVLSLGAQPRLQMKLKILLDDDEKRSSIKSIAETGASLWVDKKTGIISSFEVKPFGFPLLKLKLVHRSIK